MIKHPFWRKYFIELILLKEIPYGFIVLVGILSYAASQIWDEQVVSVEQNEPVNIQSIPDLTTYEIANKISSLSNEARNCSSLLNHKNLYIHRFKFTNYTLDFSISRGLPIIFGYDQSSDLLVFAQKFQLGKGGIRPSISKTDSTGCSNRARMTINNLQAGASVTIHLLSKSKYSPYYYSEPNEGDFRIIPYSQLRAFLFQTRNHSSLVIPVIVLFLLIYFTTYAYVRVKYL